MAIPNLLIRQDNKRPSDSTRRPRGEQHPCPNLTHSLTAYNKARKSELISNIDPTNDIEKQLLNQLVKPPLIVDNYKEKSEHTVKVKTSIINPINSHLLEPRWSRKKRQPHISAYSVTILTVILTTTLIGHCLATQTENPATQQAVEVISSSTIYQPALIGFRCESSQETTPDGVSVVEANSAVTLTLFGESFTTNTIVAFTTEKVGPEPEYERFSPTTTTTTPTPSKERQLDLDLNSMMAQNSSIVNNQVDQPASTEGPIRRSISNRRTRNSDYDCTDFNRVVSYKLNAENIISETVAILVVTLPELASGSGRYYYFCLKQPKLTDKKSNFLEQNVLEATPTNESSYVWVHQGNEWWVTIKVEPPILSMANDCLLIIFLLFLSAVTSGLNLGLMSLDMNELAVISSCGDQRERSYARTIAPLRRRGNYLLCSLLLGNVMVNSTLTVILEEMTSGLVAIIGSTLAIVILGEILPQAFCARQGLAIGARTIYLTYAFMIITFPLSYPISCLLDYVLGEEKGNVYDRERLMEFIKITGHHTQLEADEVAIISGALKLKKIKVDQIMTRIEDVFMLPIDCKLDRETIKRIIEKGYSRIPVYEFGDRKQIVALILAKDLALLDPDDHTPIANMLLYCKHPLIFIEDDTTLDVALNEFKTGKSHMAVVRQIYDDGEIDKYYEAIGVVTLEDVIEEVLQVEINDETDTLSDNRRKRRRTDAQVAHLIDEFTGGSSQSLQVTASSAATLALELGNNLPATSAGQNHQQQQSTPRVSTIAVSKQVQTSLSNHLTSVSVQSVAQSVGQHQQSSSIQFSGSSQQNSQDSQEQPETGMLGRAAQFLSNIMS